MLQRNLETNSEEVWWSDDDSVTSQEDDSEEDPTFCLNYLSSEESGWSTETNDSESSESE